MGDALDYAQKGRAGIAAHRVEAFEHARNLDRIQPVCRQLPAVDSADFPNARVKYSLVWELWGWRTPDWNAAVGALFAAQEQRNQSAASR
jgi:hypothetical protein